MIASEMSSCTNSNRNQESEEEDTIDVASPYNNEIEHFDNPESFPDLKLMIPGTEKPLELHRKILAGACEWFKETLKDKEEPKIEWGFDTTKKVDKEALVKALRFCYGETLCVGTKNGECCAVIAALTRLQVTCLSDVVTTLSNFALTLSLANVKTGVELLKASAGYTECCNESQVALDEVLARTVLTNDNMCSHFRDVVDNCLMLLPPKYLMLAEYGEPHSRGSEYSLRARYVRSNMKNLNKEEKQAVMCHCDFSVLNSHELRELRMADILSRDELFEAYEKALEYCEIECEETKNQMSSMKEERDKAVQERSEMEARLKQVEKDRDERVKHLESETDEANKRAKQAEAEREEFQKRTEIAESKSQMLSLLNPDNDAFTLFVSCVSIEQGWKWFVDKQKRV